MKEIHLTKGHIAIVDDEDFDQLSGVSWYASESRRHKSVHIYAATRSIYIGAKPVFRYMHREIMQAPPHLEVDHRNHNTLDNTRENLRICTRSQNTAHQHTKRGRSGYRGVWAAHDNLGQWVAMIKRNGKQISLGTYSTPELAAAAYDKAAIAIFGEFAVPNFPAGQTLGPRRATA